MRVRLIFSVTLIASLSAAAQSTPSKPVPRLANGKPDLTGVWDHPRVGDVSKDVNGRCVGGTAGCSSIGAHDLDSTLTPFGKAENAKTKFDYGVHCLPWGYVRSWGTPYPAELVQKPEKLAILFEQNNMFHVVPTDGRDHSKNLYPTWLGDSVGHWEGDTLVVDTIGSNGQTWLDTEPQRLTSDALHVIERFSRPDYNHIQYEVTADDPKMYTKPWKNTRVFVLMQPGQELLEYSCDENNKEITEGHITDSWTKKK
ncbi:MAG TPA: hypothetical protein VIY49_28710 [Bryobacteraceae bacterium]